MPIQKYARYFIQELATNSPIKAVYWIKNEIILIVHSFWSCEQILFPGLQLKKKTKRQQKHDIQRCHVSFSL